MNLSEIKNQLLLCGYTDKIGHPLENNEAFIALSDIEQIPIGEKGWLTLWVLVHDPYNCDTAWLSIHNSKESALKAKKEMEAKHLDINGYQTDSFKVIEVDNINETPIDFFS